VDSARKSLLQARENLLSFHPYASAMSAEGREGFTNQRSRIILS
jgi:hypothetical protein